MSTSGRMFAGPSVGWISTRDGARRVKTPEPTRSCYFCRQRRRCRAMKFGYCTFTVPVCAPCRRKG